ncbi:MAG: nucleotidyl transferase AbiEii/AbiGii toxin family protein [Candidatus Marsarchaeota archaeon]|nr:nucleotidyl transferase AbiEii/AbiGii toxin family protein [Candidatus Marsarchaeota archaeon]
MTVDPDQIKKITSEFGLSNDLVERHLNALEIAQDLQKYEKGFILFGGTAAQFYIPSNLQRTSLDVDIITNYSYPEISEIMKKFLSERDLPDAKTKKLKTTYGIRFAIPIKLNFSKGRFEYNVQIEIASKAKEKLNPINKRDCILHNVNVGEFRLLTMEDIFAKKILTLDLENLGIHKDSGRDMNLDISKQLSDIYQLYTQFGEQEFGVIGKNIFQQLDNEIKNAKADCTPSSCIKNICKLMSSLSLVETKQSTAESTNLRKGYKGLRDSYLPKDARLTFDDWGSLGWTFDHLLESIDLDGQNSENKRALEHYKIRENCKKNDRSERTKVIEELSIYDSIPKPYKNRPLSSLFFKKELMEGLK